MFLGNTQKKELAKELKLALREDLVFDIEKNGVNSSLLDFTDVDNQQICIKLNEDKFIYSQQTKFFYDWFRDNDIDVKDYYTDTIDLSILSEKEIRSEISGFYGSIEEVKEIYGDSYKQILAECIFETIAI